MPRFNNGFIKLHRTIMDGDLATHNAIFALFVRLIIMANWRETKIYWSGKQIVLPPGSVVCGGEELAEKLQVSRRTLRRYLSYLTDTSRIAQLTNSQGTIVTILNYSKYQVEGNLDSESLPNKRPINAQQTPNKRPLIEEGKEGKKVKNNTYTADFEILWKEYPKKTGKIDAFEAFKKNVDIETELGLVSTAIKNYTNELVRNQTESKYIKHMASFLNKGRWRDCLEADYGTSTIKKKSATSWLDEAIAKEKENVPF